MTGRARLECGQAKSITDLAEQEGVTDAYVCRLLPLTCLVPDLVAAILDGRQPKGLRLAEPWEWAVEWTGKPQKLAGPLRQPSSGRPSSNRRRVARASSSPSATPE